MIAIETVAAATTPDGSELVLHRRDDVFTLRLDGVEVMTSRAYGSEEELARLALADLRRRAACRVLIGGLGMGFTLRAALDALPAGARVEVVEVYAAVIDWNREHLGHLAGFPLEDGRVRVACDDLADRLARARSHFDALLLDVDNGPSSPCRRVNSRLYGPAGLARMRSALAPGGVLAVWSADPDPAFLRRLRRAGLRARYQSVRSRPGGRGPRHGIFLALTRPAPGDRA